jgi:hypothetical protein
MFTQLLIAIAGSNPHAGAQLLPWGFDKLRPLAARKVAREKPGQTLDAMAVVHEA